MYTFYFRKCSWLLGIILFFPIVYLRAQEKTMSLPDLVAAAKNYYPSIQQKKASLNAAESIVTDTKHHFLPQFKIAEQLNLGTDNSMAGAYLPIGTIPSVSGGIRGQNNMQAALGNIGTLYAEYELINFGYHKARINSDLAYVNLQAADLHKEQYDLSIAVSNLFFQVLKLQNKMDVDQENLARYQSIFKVISALGKSGLIAGADSSLALAELTKASMSLNQNASLYKQLKMQLNTITGISLENIKLLQPKTTLTDFNLVNASNPNDSMTHPYLQFVQKQKEIWMFNEQQIKKEFLPKILLTGATWARGSSIQYNDQYKSIETGLNYQRFNYAIGIGVNYPLLNGLFKKDKLRINRFQIEASESLIQQELLQLKLGFNQANEALRSANLNLMEFPTALKAAGNVYQQKMAQYKAGIISLIDLTNASFVLYRSQTDWLDTVTDWYLAQMRKAIYAGNLEQFIQTIK